MNVGGLRWGRYDPLVGEGILAAARDAAPTYAPLGHTLEDTPGVHARSLSVGRGPQDFAAAREAVRTWVTHRGIGASVVPADAEVAEGTTVLVVLRAGPFHVIAPNRIVAVLDEERRCGFAYGTLPGHPERGEESFLVELLDDGGVRATVRVAARPASWSARLAAPIVLLVQRWAVRAYLKAIATHVEQARGPRLP